MNLLKLTIIALSLFFILSCGVPDTSGRKAVPPQGSDPNNMPWNVPQQGEGGGALGGMMNQMR